MPGSFGRLVKVVPAPNHFCQAMVRVELYCPCMRWTPKGDASFRGKRNKGWDTSWAILSIQRVWDESECDVISEEEFEKLKQHHICQKEYDVYKTKAN